MKYSSKVGSLSSRFVTVLAVVAVGGSIALSAAGVADAATPANPATSANQQQRLQTIISKGDQEITRRLASLSTLSSKITAATKLSSSDSATLSNEVSATVSGLTNLKTQLDADTTVSSAHTDAVSIYTEYRVYALVAPKIGLVKVADDQQVIQGKLTALAQKLQARITAEQQAGKNVTALQADLTDMTNQTAAAQKISSSIESSVITLQPTDYNSNHAVLSGDNAQLKTAHSDDKAAYTDAKNIISALKSL